MNATTSKRSKGAVLLRRLSLTYEEVAVKIGVSQRMVHYWADGSKKPSSATRSHLEREFAIASAAWDEEATGLPPDPASGPQAVEGPREAEAPPATTFENGMLRSIHRAEKLLARIEVDINATPAEIMRLNKDVQRMWIEHARATGELELGPKLFKLAIWKRVEEEFVRALKPYPEALSALRAALRRVEDELARGG